MRTVRLLLHAAALAAIAATIAAWLHGPEGVTSFFWVVLAAGSVIAAVLLGPGTARSEGLRRALRLVDRIALALVVTLASGELFLRVAARLWPSALLAPTDARAAERVRAYRLPPGSMHLGQRVNAQGFLDDPFVLERTPKTRRIVALGDSFAIGVVDASKNFLTLLDQQLDAHEPTEVDNFGVSSTSPRDYLHLWRTEARAYDPDLVLVCFFVGNDVDTVRAAGPLHADSLLLFSFVRRILAVKRELAAGANAKETAAASSSVPLSAAGEPGPGTAAGESGSGPASSPEVGRFTAETYRDLERGRLEVCRRQPTAHVAKEWDDTLALLAEMARDLGPKLRLVILPDQFQVDDALFAEIAPKDGDRFDRELPQRRLLAFGAEHHVPVLDLLPALRAAEHDGPTYALRDTHWNERGNAVAAGELTRWLSGAGH